MTAKLTTVAAGGSLRPGLLSSSGLGIVGEAWVSDMDFFLYLTNTDKESKEVELDRCCKI